jgi:hypothetical protein
MKKSSNPRLFDAAAPGMAPPGAHGAPGAAGAYARPGGAPVPARPGMPARP